MKWAIKLARTLHIYISLLGFLLFGFFALTGVMLTHENFGLDKARVSSKKLSFPRIEGESREALIERVRNSAGEGRALVSANGAGNEWEFTFAGPGKRITVNLRGDQMEVQGEDKGWAGTLGDLHRNADSGPLWKWVLDIGSVLLGLSSLSGVILIVTLPKRRALGLLAMAAGTILVLLVYAFGVPS
jgi:uncharacterized protein